jgi:acetyltransferase EpsM
VKTPPSPILPGLVIIGAGGHARVVADIVRLLGQHAIAGYLDDAHPERHGQEFEGARILGGLEQLGRAAALGVHAVFVAIGECEARLRFAEAAVAAGLTLPILVHPRSVVASSASLGAGSVLAAGAIVNPGATIGANVIVNTAASVDHDCRIEDGVHLACGVRLAGHVHVGRATWVGIGAIVKEGVRIGAGSMVGAGALVLRDVPDGVLVHGSPATVIRPLIHDHTTRV